MEKEGERCAMGGGGRYRKEGGGDGKKVRERGRWRGKIERGREEERERGLESIMFRSSALRSLQRLKITQS